MPGAGPKEFRCKLCTKRTKPNNRRHVTQQIRKFLRKTFMVEAHVGDVMCNKCVLRYYKEQKVGKCQENHSCAASTSSTLTESSTPKSPPSINLPIASTVRTHAYCFICKRPGPKLCNVPADLRFQVFLRKKILLPAGCRCCPVHISGGEFTQDVFDILHTTNDIFVNRTTLLDLVNKLRNHALQSAKLGIDFDDDSLMSDDDYHNLTGHCKSDFSEICRYAANAMRNTPVRSIRTSVGIFLLKLRAGIANSLMATLFNITKSSLRRAIFSVRKALMTEFVPSFLGMQHITREDVINHHTRPLAQSLLAGDSIDAPAILVLDGTYIHVYIQKSDNFRFQRRTFSLRKGRPLVKPMVICTTTGHFLSILGPYFSDTKNNDAAILNHIMKNNIESIQEWVKEHDVFVVDRGFRDSLEPLLDLGIKAKMPSFFKRAEKQMSVQDTNSSRLVTKIRWVIESANSRIKKWKYLSNVLPTNQVPHIGDYVRIVCALSNRFLPPLSQPKEDDDALAAKMIYLSKQTNMLQTYIAENCLERRSVIWKEAESLENFPYLDEDYLRHITCGTYQLKLGPSYIQEHIAGEAEILVHKEDSGFIRVKIQSRHISSRKYVLWIRFTEEDVVAYYCKCRAGARVVGMCSHIAAVLWYLGHARHQQRSSIGVQNWGEYLDDATAIDDSDTDDSIIEE